MPSIAEVRQELVTEFEGIAQTNGDFLEHCASIGALLSGGLGAGVIEEALVSLDTRMFDVIDQRLTPQTKALMASSQRRENFGQAAVAGAFKPKSTPERKAMAANTSPLTTSGNDPFSKVLATALAEFERNLNYPHNVDDRFHPRYVGFVPGNVFLQNVALGAHWKDVGASPDHGEFTHQIQWYVIAASGRVPTNKVGEVYRTIGSCGLSAKNPDGFGQKALWARLLDRPTPQRSGDKPGGTGVNTDYRSPELFNAYLRRGGEKFPLLANFLEERHAKRSGGGDGDAFPNVATMRNYCAKKLFRQASYANLGGDQKAAVDDIVGPGKSNILTVAA